MSDLDWEDTAPIRESGYARRRRNKRRRMVTTLLLVLLALFFAFWYAYSYYRGDRAASKPTPVCVTPTPTAKPGTFDLNVYNATTRDGIAGAASKTLTSRGFTVKSVANDPLKKPVKEAAQVRSGKAGAKNAQLVAEQVAGAVKVVDGRKDASVDLVLGNAYKALAAAKPAPTPTCTTPTK